MSPSIENRGGAPSVTLLVRHNHTMTVDCTDTSELLAAVERKISVPREATWLCFAGKKLEAGMPLTHYGLSAGSTVHLAMRGRGGGAGTGKHKAPSDMGLSESTFTEVRKSLDESTFSNVCTALGTLSDKAKDELGKRLLARSAEAPETPQGAADLTRYTEPASIWRALETGHVRLLKASYLTNLSDANGVLSRRQELPPEAFISVEELKRLYGEGNRDGVLPIIAILFCWETAAHPDPRGKQLVTVATTLKREMGKYAKFFSEMGVFWDWAALSQRDPRLWTPACMKEDADLTPDEEQQKRKYEASRSEEETTGFKYALHETMDLWYAHQGTTVYMLTELPEGTTREVGYADSGWTTYERRSAEQIKKVYLYEAEWKLVLDLGAEDAEKSRNWPLDPGGFDALIDTKKFTNGADKEAVKTLFRKMSGMQLAGIEVLDFTGIAVPTVEDAEQLGRCLNLCKSLDECNLTNVGLTAATCRALCSTLTNEAHIEKLMCVHRELRTQCSPSMCSLSESVNSR